MTTHRLDYLPAGTIALDRYRRAWQRVDDTTPGSDHLARRWLALQPGPSVPLAQAHAAFLAWAAQVGVPPVPQRRFSAALTSRGATRTQHGPGRASILHDITLPTPRARTSAPGGHHHDNMKGTSS